MICKNNLEATPEFVAGEVILIDKSLDWTSFDIIKSLKIFLKFEFGLKKNKIGHAGTLDPRATGLVIVCTGKKTKEIDKYQAREKEYTGTFHLGKTTPTLDTESQPDHEYPIDHLSPELIVETTKSFLGSIIQIPPIYSALKIDGKKAYEYARNNQEVKMRERQVEISEFEITKIEMPEVSFRVKCSKGTYIRTLADDFGKALKSGAYLSSLRRTSIGEFKVEDAISVQEFKDNYKKTEGGE